MENVKKTCRNWRNLLKEANKKRKTMTDAFFFVVVYLGNRPKDEMSSTFNAMINQKKT